MSEVHAIMNMDKYSAYIRKRAAASISEDYSENLDEFVTIAQTSGIIVEHCIGKDEDGHYLLDENSHSKLFEAVRTRLFNCGLSKLAADGALECAWDDAKNEMVFWKPGQKPPK